MTSPSRSSSSSIMIFPDKKLVRRESSSMSMEAYYYHGGKGASVPFDWESEPGTPKFKSRDPSLPPLTPPPPYHYNKTYNKSKKSNKPRKRCSLNPNNSILQTLFVKRATRKQPPLPSPSLSSSSLSSRAYFSAPSSSVIYSQKSEEEDMYDMDLHNSARWRGGCSFMIKKVLHRDFL